MTINHNGASRREYVRQTMLSAQRDKTALLTQIITDPGQSDIALITEIISRQPEDQRAWYAGMLASYLLREATGLLTVLTGGNPDRMLQLIQASALDFESVAPYLGADLGDRDG